MQRSLNKVRALTSFKRIQKDEYELSFALGLKLRKTEA
jgi:hypothetical protein